MKQTKSNALLSFTFSLSLSLYVQFILKRCLLNIDLLLKYFHPTATIELFVNWTSHSIRKLLRTLSLQVSIAVILYLLLPLFLLFVHYAFHHFILSTKTEHDEMSRDTHFAVYAVWNESWKKKKESKKKRKQNEEKCH